MTPKRKWKTARVDHGAKIGIAISHEGMRLAVAVKNEPGALAYDNRKMLQRELIDWYVQRSESAQ